MTIKNFKCFENETFRFHPQFNVIIGKNASGKTSLLDALAGFASFYLFGINEEFYKYVQESEVRTILIDGQPRKQEPVILSAKGSIHNIAIDWKEQRGHDGNQDAPIDFKERFENWKPIMSDYARKDLIESRKLNGATVVFPLIAYYGTGRLWGAESKEHKEELNYFKQEEGVFTGYSECLNPKSSSDTFLLWYKTYEDTINKFQQLQQILLLKVFRDTISSMIPEWTDMAYNFLEDDLMGIFRNEDGQVNMLPFKNLSDGYRNMIGMVADMVYRCIQLNPGLRERAVLETDGIVLIDELDLHLHPEWQRNIVADLKRVFPKIQFIVTTHSPFIIQSLTKEELIVLDKDFVEDKDPFRKSVEEISEDEMRVTDVPRSSRFIEMTNIAKEYFTLVKENDTKDSLRVKITEAKQRLDKLRILYSDDPAYVAMLETELEKTETNAANN